MSERFCISQHFTNERILAETEEYWQKRGYETFRSEPYKGYITVYRKKPTNPYPIQIKIHGGLIKPIPTPKIHGVVFRKIGSKTEES